MCSSGNVKDVEGSSDSDGDSSIDSNDCWIERANLVLNSLSNLYSELDIFFVYTSRLSSCSTLHFLLTT